MVKQKMFLGKSINVWVALATKWLNKKCFWVSLSMFG